MPLEDRDPFFSPGDEDYLVERDTRLSESLLWALQRRFYAAHGADLWGSGRVPSYVTTNAWVARAYARVLVHTLMDLAEVDPDRAVTVLEVGGGSGRLAFLILTELDELLPHCGDRLPPFRYVLSDLSEQSLQAWEALPAFASWVASGRLDFARYDLSDREPILRLRGTGETRDAHSPGGPMVVIASYVLDSLVQDAFRVREGGLDEGRVNLLADHIFANADDPEVLSGMAMLFGWRPVDPGPYYAQGSMEALLRSYIPLLRAGAFGFPLGALQSLQALAAMCEGGLLMLSTDKAWCHPSQLEGQTAPFVLGHGSASMMIDHHAMGRWVQTEGGSCLMTSPRKGGVETALFALGQTGPLDLTRLAFHTELEAFSPADFTALTVAMDGAAMPRLDAVLRLLRMGAWDPAWLRSLMPSIRAHAATAPALQQAELHRALDHVERRIFPLEGEGFDTRALLAEARSCAGPPD